MKPGSVAVNHAGLWILQPRFESVPGYLKLITVLVPLLVSILTVAFS